MRRIEISSSISSIVDGYVIKLIYKKPHQDGNVSRATRILRKQAEKFRNEELKAINTTLSDGTIVNPLNKQAYADYLELIARNYECLLRVHPCDFIGIIQPMFEMLIPKKALAIDIGKSFDGQGKATSHVKFHELIVDALRYDYVQSKVYPSIARQLGIKTCVYCNAQFAITIKNGEPLYQLDHCYPKSLYPYLAVSFFNLQPCCGACNQRKLAEDMRKGVYDVSIWREPSDKESAYYHFHISDSSLVDYRLNLDCEKLNIEFLTKKSAPKDLIEMRDLYVKKFRIEDIYQEHKDVVEEVLWKYYAYTPAFIQSLNKIFKGLKKIDNRNLARFIMGTYMNSDEVYKRPLSQLIQDIAKQLHINFGLMKH